MDMNKLAHDTIMLGLNKVMHDMARTFDEIEFKAILELEYKMHNDYIIAFVTVRGDNDFDADDFQEYEVYRFIVHGSSHRSIQQVYSYSTWRGDSSEEVNYSHHLAREFVKQSIDNITM